jgi:hypothetical protein
MPRSGTSWLGQIFDSSPNVAYRLEPIFAYAFKNAVDEKSSKEDYLGFFDGIYRSKDEFLLQEDKRKLGIYPRFIKRENPEFLVFKTTRFHHLLEDILKYFDNLKMISIVRHPCGAICSWLNTSREFPSSADPIIEWRTGSCRKTAKEEFWGFEDWKKVTLLHMYFEKQYPSQFKIIKYEELVKNTTKMTKDLFEFAGLGFENQTTKFIHDCHGRHDQDSYSVFKKKDVVFSWKSKLPLKIQKQIIDEIKETPLEIYL